VLEGTRGAGRSRGCVVGSTCRSTKLPGCSESAPREWVLAQGCGRGGSRAGFKVLVPNQLLVKSKADLLCSERLSYSSVK